MNAPDKNIPVETIEKVFRYVVNRGFPYHLVIKLSQYLFLKKN